MSTPQCFGRFGEPHEVVLRMKGYWCTYHHKTIAPPPEVGCQPSWGAEAARKERKSQSRRRAACRRRRLQREERREEEREL